MRLGVRPRLWTNKVTTNLGVLAGHHGRQGGQGLRGELRHQSAQWQLSDHEFKFQEQGSMGLTFQALTWIRIPLRRVCPGPGWPLGPRGRESAPQLPEAEPCQSNQYLIYLKVSCNRCPFKCPPFHCEQPRQRKEEEGRGKNGLGAFFPTKW